MHIAAWLAALVGTVLAVSYLAARWGIAAPLVLTAVGVAASYVPGVPDVPLEPEMVLLGLLPPLLYATAIRGSVVDLRADFRSITMLSVALVIFSAFGVALVVWWLVDVPFAAALALGAVVAPPDAVAATAVGRRIGLPRRVLTMLEGESLFNDATAIVLLRTAIAAISGSVTVWGVGLSFLWAAAGGALIGIAAAFVAGFFNRKFKDATLTTGLSFLTPWIAYLPAEAVDASGVVATVVCGLIIGHTRVNTQSALARVSQTINWNTVQFLLENAVFLLIGLQMRRIVSDVEETDLSGWRIAALAVAVLVSLLLLRLVWVGGVTTALRIFAPTNENALPPRQAALLGWAGMRGVVTLATVFVLPEDTPHRTVLVLVAMVAAAGTLLVYGTTLPTLARVLRVTGPDARSDALQEAVVMRTAIAAGISALDDIENNPDYEIDAEVLADLRRRAEFRANAHWERLGPESVGTPDAQYRKVRLAMLDAERHELVRLRNAGGIDHEVFEAVLFSLDVEESQIVVAEGRAAEHSAVADLIAPARVSDDCEDLQVFDHHDPKPQSKTCLECVADGQIPVALRICLACGHVACCDSSPGRHATKHFHDTGHPVIRSFEPGERWRWCYIHEITG